MRLGRKDNSHFQMFPNLCLVTCLVSILAAAMTTAGLTWMSLSPAPALLPCTSSPPSQTSPSRGPQSAVSWQKAPVQITECLPCPKAPVQITKYRLSHLVAPEEQKQWGPMQDDEMLFLYSFIRVTRSARILELGGLKGDSARNFLQATEGLVNSSVYTVEKRKVQQQGPRHVTIQKDATLLTAADVQNAPLDLILLDCHHYDATMGTLRALDRASLIPNTTLALHDTGLHGTRMHQIVERIVVNELIDKVRAASHTKKQEQYNKL